MGAERKKLIKLITKFTQLEPNQYVGWPLRDLKDELLYCFKTHTEDILDDLVKTDPWGIAGKKPLSPAKQAIPRLRVKNPARKRCDL